MVMFVTLPIKAHYMITYFFFQRIKGVNECPGKPSSILNAYNHRKWFIIPSGEMKRIICLKFSSFENVSYSEICTHIRRNKRERNPNIIFTRYSLRFSFWLDLFLMDQTQSVKNFKFFTVNECICYRLTKEFVRMHAVNSKCTKGISAGILRTSFGRQCRMSEWTYAQNSSYEIS